MTITTSERQAPIREERCEGSPEQNCELMNKNIHQQLRDGTYRPLPIRRIRIPKPDGGEPLLGIPTVMDRVLQQAILQVLSPIFDPDFSEYSYGFRPQRSAGQAVKHLHSSIKAGYKIAVDVDLSKFFDRVNHDLLMNRLGRKVQDKAIKRLIGKYLRAGISENGWCTKTTEGVPQGGLCKALHKPPYAK